mgnify:CR=1 FL=1
MRRRSNTFASVVRAWVNGSSLVRTQACSAMLRRLRTSARKLADLSTFVALYNRLDDGDGRVVTAAMLLSVWEVHCRLAQDHLEINAAWYAIRDVRSRIVSWHRCARCQAMFIYEPDVSQARSCPFCRLAKARG